MLIEITDYEDFKSAMERFCAFLSSQKIPDERVFDSRLVAHELLGNVLQHSNGRASLRVELAGEDIHIYVRSEIRFQPPSAGQCPEQLAERGRGIYLVDQVSVERTYTEDGEIFVRIRRTK